MMLTLVKKKEEEKKKPVWGQKASNAAIRERFDHSVFPPQTSGSILHLFGLGLECMAPARF